MTTNQTNGSKAVAGTVYGLAAWFDMSRNANGPADDQVREEILADLFTFTAWATAGGRVVLHTAKGRALVERKSAMGCPIVEIDHVERGRWVRTTFWMNASSVSDLGNALRQAPGMRGDFASLLLNE